MVQSLIVLLSALCCISYSMKAMDLTVLGKAALLNVNEKEFDYSFLTQKSYNPKIIPNLALSGGVPAIGRYATPYTQRSRLALIQSDPKLASSAFSRHFAEQLLTQLNFPIEHALESVAQDASEEKKQEAINSSLSQILESIGSNATFTIALWGTLPSPDGIYNITFHPVVSNWLYEDNTLIPNAQWITSKDNPAITYTRYSTDLLAGLFDPKGVEQKGDSPIAFNAFSSQNIVTHASDRADYYDDMSPNNVHFAVTPNHKISTFWTALFSSKKDRLALTFNILINNETLEQALEKELHKAKNPDTFVDTVSTLFSLLKDNPQDTKTLQEALSIIGFNHAATQNN
ncbi:hypothetical protein H0X48_03540 [Candidatus Dependentiae bacterium]|nr:hypothetical protein [Candidatus Dependentiae bacterium]